MHEKMLKSLDALLANSLRHCRNHRLADYDLRQLPEATLRRLMSSTLDFLQYELERALIATSDELPPNGRRGGSGSAPTREIQLSSDWIML